jgi:hypothetical protein
MKTLRCACAMARRFRLLVDGAEYFTAVRRENSQSGA